MDSSGGNIDNVFYDLARSLRTTENCLF